MWNYQASTPGSSVAVQGQEFHADRDQSCDVLVRDEAVNSGPAGVNYRVSSVTLSFISHGKLYGNSGEM